jgi:DNA-binding protein H-NS
MSQLLFVIVLGVFIANMLSWGAQRGIDYLVAKEMLRQATEEMAEINARTQAKLEEQRRINAVVAKQRETENQKREAGLRQAMETCTYWREQYRKDGSSYNRLQRDQSCNFVSEFR